MQIVADSMGAAKDQDGVVEGLQRIVATKPVKALGAAAVSAINHRRIIIKVSSAIHLTLDAKLRLGCQCSVPVAWYAPKHERVREQCTAEALRPQRAVFFKSLLSERSSVGCCYVIGQPTMDSIRCTQLLYDFGQKLKTRARLNSPCHRGSNQQPGSRLL